MSNYSHQTMVLIGKARAEHRANGMGRLPAGLAGAQHRRDGGKTDQRGYPQHNPFDVVSEGHLRDQFDRNFAAEGLKAPKRKTPWKAACGTTHAARVAAAMED